MRTAETVVADAVAVAESASNDLPDDGDDDDDDVNSHDDDAGG